MISIVFGELARRLIFAELHSDLLSLRPAAIECGNIFSYVPDMSKARGGMIEVVRMLDARPDIDAEEPVGKAFNNCTGHIKFSDVHFRYPTRPHVRVLRGLE